MFANLNGQLVQILYKSSIKKLKIDFDEIMVRETNDYEILDQVEKYKNKPVRIMVKDDSSNIYEFTGKMKKYSREAGGVYICRRRIKIAKNGKFLNRTDELSLENVEFMIVSNIPKAKAKIVLTYEKDLPFLLEFHADRQQAEELKKRIEGGTPITIEVEQYAKYNPNYGLKSTEKAEKIG